MQAEWLLSFPRSTRLGAALRSLWLVVAIGCVLRFCLTLRYVDPAVAGVFKDHWIFGYEAGRIARSIALGQGFSNPLYDPSGPTAWMGPVFPYIVAAIFKILGPYSRPSALAIFSLTSLFSALTAVPVFFLAKRVFGKNVAWVSAWAWTFYPHAVVVASSIWETALAGLLFSAVLALTVKLEDWPRKSAWAAYGLLWGLTALTNPSVLMIFPVALGWVCLRLRRERRRFLALASTAGVALLLSLTPWTIRNAQVFHHFVPIRDDFGLEVWVGNHGDTWHWFPYRTGHPSGSDAELAEFNRLGEWDYMQRKQAQAFEYIGTHPGEYAVLVLRRALLMWTSFWQLDPVYRTENPDMAFWVVTTTLTTFLMLFGLRRAWPGKRDHAMLLIPILAIFPLTYYLTLGNLRYRYPIEPVILIFAVYGALELRTRMATRS